ncbi:cytochrome b5-like [Salvia splendens]|uniref:cytochrome b5-like n=1 Tax=Salvia splendens TaxID=180675 RepID=UPI001103405B|nr:cytochrome b5-like [Salvia splendens]
MEEKVLSFEEVSKHNTTGDCWVVIHGKVYDVTRFLDEHPGGDEVLLNASSGMDATVEFEDVSHTDYARELMKDFLIGKIDENTLPNMQKKFTRHDASLSNDSSSHLLLYTAPLFVLAFAFLLRYYNYNNNNNY